MRSVTDAGGKILHFEGFIEDITKNRAMEDALRESEEKFRSIFQNSVTGMTLVGLDGRYLMVNPAICELLGYTVEELLAKDIFMITHPDDMEISREAMRGVLKGKGKTIRFDKRYIHKDGHTIWTEVSSALVYDAGGKPSHFVTQVIDITGRKQAEEALRESEKKYKTISELVSDYIFRVEVKGKGNWLLDFISEKFRKETGRGIEEVRTAGQWGKIIHPDDMRRLVDFGKTVETGKSGFVEVRSVRKDGKMRWVSVFARPEWDARREKVVAIIGAVKDVTDRKQAEEVLRESEEHYRSLFQNSLEGIGLSRGNTVLDANKALLEIFGYDNLTEFISIPLIDHVAPASKALIRKYQEQGRKGEPHDNRFTYQIIRKDGAIRDIEISLQHITDEQGVLTQSTFRDITDRKQAEERLAGSEKQFRTLIELSPDPIFIHTEGMISYVNSAGLALLGAKSTDQVVGRTAFDIVCPEYHEMMKRGFAEGVKNLSVIPPHEEKYLRLDGTTVDVEAIVKPIILEGKTCAQVIVRDITERKRAEEALQASEERYRLLYELSPIPSPSTRTGKSFTPIRPRFDCSEWSRRRISSANRCWVSSIRTTRRW